MRGKDGVGETLRKALDWPALAVRAAPFRAEPLVAPNGDAVDAEPAWEWDIYRIFFALDLDDVDACSHFVRAYGLRGLSRYVLPNLHNQSERTKFMWALERRQLSPRDVELFLSGAVRADLKLEQGRFTQQFDSTRRNYSDDPGLALASWSPITSSFLSEGRLFFDVPASSEEPADHYLGVGNRDWLEGQLVLRAGADDLVAHCCLEVLVELQRGRVPGRCEYRECGRVFFSKRVDQRYCSPSHKDAAFYEENKDYLREYKRLTQHERRIKERVRIGRATKEDLKAARDELARFKEKVARQQPTKRKPAPRRRGER